MHIRRRWLIVGIAFVALIVITALIAVSRVPINSKVLRERVIATLERELDSEVELQDLAVRIYPRLSATGTGLVVRFHRRHDVPPLLAIQEFAVDATLGGLWRRRVDHVGLRGLEINVPPRQPDDRPQEPAPGVKGRSESSLRHSQVVIDTLDAPDTTLTILRADPEKAPRVWYLHSLRLREVGLDTQMPFETQLTNAVPPGEIAATGTFGPWSTETPSATPVAGVFTFSDANLSVFPGISGMLNATGSFDGSLDRIAVDGQTSSQDFMVNIGAHPVPLTATYHAVVDATNGNTTLDPVRARVLNTPIVARGGVYDVEGVKGRVVRLDVDIEDGRIEDMLQLAVPTPHPTMTGGLQLRTLLTIPPGTADVVDRLGLDGRFAIERGRFTDRGVQQRLSELSRRARGQRLEPSKGTQAVTSGFAGRFKLANGRLSIPTVTFDVPGAVVTLAGSYRLRRQTLDFSGNLHMDAKLSQTTSGWKSWLLKAADPLFRRNGKTVIPLKINGTRNSPKFGLDTRRIFRRD
ncbi:MAG: AsmA-like C-terminal region-containing protein [Vicinamibacterales bacterium]